MKHHHINTVTIIIIKKYVIFIFMLLGTFLTPPVPIQQIVNQYVLV